jgi:DNA-binding CsgD family transcriptional regulator
VNAYGNAQARSLLSAVGREMDGRGEALVLLDHLGEPLAMTSHAGELLAAFGDGARGRIPDRVWEWVRRMRRSAPLPAEPLLAMREDLTVEARLLTPSVVALRPLRVRLEADALGPLGLARRERDVLALVADGHTNKEIAARLGVEPLTVKKHLERIYEKLGVNTRTAAAAAAFRAAADEKAPRHRVKRTALLAGK